MTGKLAMESPFSIILVANEDYWGANEDNWGNTLNYWGLRKKRRTDVAENN
jgi:hypothetical protein